MTKAVRTHAGSNGVVRPRNGLSQRYHGGAGNRAPIRIELRIAKLFVLGPLVVAAPTNTEVRRLSCGHPEFASQTRQQVHRRRYENRPISGVRLTSRQEQIAKEKLGTDLTREPSIADVAAACHMPARRFVRAFRHTTGMPPYRWLRAFRVEHAKELLLNSSFSLAQIAHDCGFADQSHFTRVFVSGVGVTPGSWRRQTP